LTQSGHFRHFLSAVRHTLLMRLTRAIGLLRAFRLLAFPALTIALTLTLSIGVMPSANAEPQRLFPIEASAKCPVKFAQYHHDYPATDIITRKGCKFLAPIDGVVDEVSRKDSWSGKTNRGQDRGGLFVSLLGSDGVRYYGSHLMEVAPGIEPGVAVMAGDVLGKVGTSGSARGTAPHLHFGLSWPTKSGEWKIRRGAVLPFKYLQSWQRGENLSPVAAVNRAQIRLPQ
jgi:murein DD-endopeptidase MepM/ murein hydrolase activator NlpD